MSGVGRTTCHIRCDSDAPLLSVPAAKQDPGTAVSDNTPVYSSVDTQTARQPYAAPFGTRRAPKESAKRFLRGEPHLT